ncbi:MAG: DUF1819 family protein [Bacteroidales bacterium]|nr:DUF1819 family protein [Bacteroidales bacterium]
MRNQKNTNSPYSAAVTGGGFLFQETEALLPLLMSADSEALLADEKLNNRVLHINSEKSRSRTIAEIRRRFRQMPISFWNDWQQLSEHDRRIALLLVLLKTYRIIFDFHVKVTMKAWRGISRQVRRDDLVALFNEIGSQDAFVDSWSDATKEKIASAYLTMIRYAGMADAQGNLSPILPEEPRFYATIGEPWFLEACLLDPYEINTLLNS